MGLGGNRFIFRQSPLIMIIITIFSISLLNPILSGFSFDPADPDDPDADPDLDLKLEEDELEDDFEDFDEDDDVGPEKVTFVESAGFTWLSVNPCKVRIKTKIKNIFRSMLDFLFFLKLLMMLVRNLLNYSEEDKNSRAF